jgi:hypothetical protein
VAIHVDDDGQWVEATSGPAIGNAFGHAFTFAALYRPTTLDSGTVLGVGSSGTSQYIALAMLDTGQGFLEVSGKDAFASSNFSDGNWHSLVGVQSSATSRVFYADGVAGTVNTDDASPVSDQLDRITVGALVINGNHVSTAFGDVAEVAIWNVGLTPDEAAMLAAHACPLLVRPSALQFYSPLWGNPPGPEVDIVGGRALVYDGFTGVGVPTAAAHPAVAMPAAATVVLADAVVSLPRDVGDIVTVSDDVARLVSSPRAIGDVVTIGDAVDRGGLVLPRAVGDPIVVTDAASRGPLVNPRAVGDPVSVTDAATRGALASPRGLGDAVNVSDSATHGPLTSPRGLGDPVPVSDAVQRTTNAAARLLGDVVSTSDAAVWALVAPRQVGDPVPVSDSATRGSVTMTRAVGDVVLVSDAVTTPADVPAVPVRVQYELHMRAAPVLATVASVRSAIDTRLEATA